MTTELTPAVQDAAYRLGWALEAAGAPRISIYHPYEPEFAELTYGALLEGRRAFTPEAEAERVEAVHQLTEPDIAAANVAARYMAEKRQRAVLLTDTQGHIPNTP